MSCTQILTEYLTRLFPNWKWCKIRYEPIEKTLYVYCVWPDYRKFLLQEAQEMAQLDIGIDRVIIAVPNFNDVVIDCQSTRDRRAF